MWTEVGQVPGNIHTYIATTNNSRLKGERNGMVTIIQKAVLFKPILCEVLQSNQYFTKHKRIKPLYMHVLSTIFFLLECRSYKSPIGRAYHEAGDEESAGKCCSIGPASNEEIYDEEDEESG